MPEIDLFSNFVSALEVGIDIPADVSPNVGQWALDSKIILDRGLFTFDRHECLREPYWDNHPFQVEMKATQFGNTTRAILRNIHTCLIKDVVGTMYLFPSRTGAGDFSRSRVAPLLERNPDMRKYIKDTDSVGLKRIKGVNAIFRGTRSEEGLRSDPVDFIVYDEYDLMPPEIDQTAKKRMDHSDMKWQHFLSNPILPDSGIDQKFKETDQRYWMMRCPKCNAWVCVEDHIDEKARDIACLMENDDGSVDLVCPKCRAAKLDPAVGQWVARNPSVTEKRGYHYSQLFSQYVDLADLYKDFRFSPKRDKVYNYGLGLPWVDAENRLSLQEIYDLCGDAGMDSSSRGPCYMGVDQGHDLHVVIGRTHPDRIVHIGVYKDWADVRRMMDTFHVAVNVIDGMPEIREPKAISLAFPGRVFRNFYNVQVKGSYVWTEGTWTVSDNRTESMDESHKMIMDGTITLPRKSAMVTQFAQHCNNVAKSLEEKPDGSKRYIYVQLGGKPDHFRHAFNYAIVARSHMTGTLLGSVGSQGRNGRDYGGDE